MAVQFPSPAADGQVYPDINNGDAALDNGRIYVYDGNKGVWNLDTPVAVGGGALKLSTLPKLVHRDNFERYQGAIWDYKMDDGSNYKAARNNVPAPKVSNRFTYWDGRWWTLFLNKEFGAEIYTSDDDGKTWNPHSRISDTATYQGVKSNTYYIYEQYGFMSNDDCLIIGTRWLSSSGKTYLHRIKKGENSFTQVWIANDSSTPGISYLRNSSVIDGDFYLFVDNRKLMRSFDNGDSWNVVDMTLTNGELYSSSNYHKIFKLPDGRLATKWRVKPTGLEDSYHIIVSSDNGETWEIIDPDREQTYKFSSGVAETRANNSVNDGAWVANGVVFNSVGIIGVDEEDCLDQRHNNFTIHAVFYTTDIDSGVWNYVEGTASTRDISTGFYNPNDKRYYTITRQGAIQCSQPGGITSKGWRYFDKAAYYGLPANEFLRYESTYFDERNNRLVFLNVGASTFDYYTFESAIQGIGADEYQNRLVTFDDLDNYLKAPVLSRTAETNSSQEARLAYTNTRNNYYGKNAPYTASSHTNSAHRYYVASRQINDVRPEVGQVRWYSKSTGGNKYIPNVGRGSDGWFSVHMKDLYRNWAIGGYRLRTNPYDASEKVIKTNGALYFANSAYRNGSTSGYPQPYFIVPFTQYSAKNDTIFVDLKHSDIIWAYNWSYGYDNNYPKSLYEIEGKLFYLYHAEGIPFIWHSYGDGGGGGYQVKPMLEY